MPELLAPAGGMDALRAAVQNGADAVYIGGKAFNARAFADNFNIAEIAAAADYCHLRGASLYVTLNTMMLQGELEQGAEEARRCWLAGADALIVADMGLAKAVRELCPIPLHASTQMCVHNVQGARITGQMGFTRAVLARELILADIRGIAQKAGIETEVFVHGALCSGVSGLCLLSSFIGERSGNRGKCAQPCRLEYEIDGKKAYHLSMADLCAAELMPELIQAGVASFKIEGRMKNSGYVGGVVRAYRKIIDAALEGKKIPKDIVANLENYYNRTFTCGYLLGNTDVTAPDRPGNRNIDKERTEEKAEDREKIFYEIEARARLAQGDRPALTLKCGAYQAEALGEEELPQAVNPLQKETVARSIGKTGGTIFAVKKTEVLLEGSPFISVSALNSLRRAGIAALEAEMLKGWHARACESKAPQPENECPHRLRLVFVQTGDAGMAVRCLKAGADRVYFAPDVYDERILGKAEAIEKETGLKPYITLPPFLRQKDMEHMDNLLCRMHGLFGGALAGNFAQIELLKGYYKGIVADYTCNIANRKTVRNYVEMGCAGITLSAELGKKDINAVKGCLPSEIIAYGYLPLMWLAHPLPMGGMKDRRGYAYRVRRIRAAGELTAVLNPVLLAMREVSSVRHGTDAVRLLLDEYREDIVRAYIHAVRQGGDADIHLENTTQGHLKRGV